MLGESPATASCSASLESASPGATALPIACTCLQAGISHLQTKLSFPSPHQLLSKMGFFPFSPQISTHLLPACFPEVAKLLEHIPWEKARCCLYQFEFCHWSSDPHGPLHPRIILIIVMPLSKMLGLNLKILRNDLINLIPGVPSLSVNRHSRL